MQNTGGSALQLSLSFQNNNLFVFPNGENTLTLQPGQTYELTIEFNPTGFDAKGVYPAGLLVQSGGQSAGLQLEGLYQLKPAGSREVQLEPLVTQLFGYKINLGTTGDGKLASPDENSPLAGDEVRSATWEAADPSKPVTALQLAAFHDCCSLSYSFELRNPGSSSAFASMKPVGVYGQSIYPRESVNGSLTELSANPTGPFEIYSAGYSSAPGKGKNKGGRLGVRLWPLKDRSGNLVEDAYLVAQDFVISPCSSSPRPRTTQAATVSSPATRTSVTKVSRRCKAPSSRTATIKTTCISSGTSDRLINPKPVEGDGLNLVTFKL